MNGFSNDTGLMAVLLPRLEKQRLPRALALRDKVNRGERLGDYDMAFLQDVFDDTPRITTIITGKYPEYRSLIVRVIDLYHEITTRALENEQGPSN